MGVSYVKFCPRCQTTIGVDAAICPNCGHRFRTHFQPPVSEKTVAMTSSPPQSGAALDDDRRPFPIPRVFVVALVLLAVLGIVFGIKARHARQPAAVHPASIAVSLPNTVVLRGDAPGQSTPIATHSLADLKQWENARSPHSLDPASSEDSPTRVHLYLANRILLVEAGTTARVIQDQGKWHQVQILDGLHRGVTGYVSDTSISPSSDTTSTPNAPLSKSP